MAAVAGTEAGNWRSGLQGGTFMLLRAHAMFSVSVTVILELTWLTLSFPPFSPLFFLFPLAVLGSLASTAAVVAHAFHTKKQFYPAVVMITNSNVSMLVRITNIYILGGSFSICLPRNFHFHLLYREHDNIHTGRIGDVSICTWNGRAAACYATVRRFALAIRRSNYSNYFNGISIFSRPSFNQCSQFNYNNHHLIFNFFIFLLCIAFRLLRLRLCVCAYALQVIQFQAFIMCLLVASDDSPKPRSVVQRLSFNRL